MTTTTHPAHGPVSLDRLHQISEILSKASAQSDGGNLGYAMADAVKVIDEVLERRQADNPPVHPTIADEKLDDETLQELIEFRRSTFEYHSKEGHKVQTIIHGVVLSALLELQERRAAMLQAGNSPATPDGWIPVSERMPGSQEWVIVFAKWANQQVLCWDDVQSRWTDFEDQSYYADMFSHWMPLPSAPQQEVKP
ncbi:DUF551 domain-containing protein [Salmonella enterica]|uniref:DUF551 domain-containing protein n=1 Tax=Salmonella enterica TaxID=28901 RepID=UPI0038BDA3F4